MPQLRDDEEELKCRAAALFNEVINSDLTALAERIDAGAPINFMGTCGDAGIRVRVECAGLRGFHGESSIGVLEADLCFSQMGLVL